MNYSRIVKVGKPVACPGFPTLTVHLRCCCCCCCCVAELRWGAVVVVAPRSYVEALHRVTLGVTLGCCWVGRNGGRPGLVVLGGCEIFQPLFETRKINYKNI